MEHRPCCEIRERTRDAQYRGMWRDCPGAAVWAPSMLPMHLKPLSDQHRRRRCNTDENARVPRLVSSTTSGTNAHKATASNLRHRTPEICRTLPVKHRRRSPQINRGRWSIELPDPSCVPMPCTSWKRRRRSLTKNITKNWTNYTMKK